MRPAHALAGMAVLAALATTVPARADVSSWLFAGLGPSVDFRDGRASSTHLSMQIETGLGTDPSHPAVFGGLMRLHPHFGLTTDWSLLLRGASRGYVQGDWGFALDLGGYQRLSEDQRGLVGSLTFGAPWGITLSNSCATAFDDELLTSFVLGVDLARLTIYRTAGTNWWPNPNLAPESGH